MEEEGPLARDRGGKKLLPIAKRKSHPLLCKGRKKGGKETLIFFNFDSREKLAYVTLPKERKEKKGRKEDS